MSHNKDLLTLLNYL